MNPKSLPDFRARPLKSQLRCFHCRKQVPSKEGNWANWSAQQVFLCKTCNVSTKSAPERSHAVV